MTSEKLSNQALTTSASYERNHLVEERSFSHIISPSGLQNKIISVTVIGTSVLEAGVFSTSLMIEPTLTTSLKTILINKKLELIS